MRFGKQPSIKLENRIPYDFKKYDLVNLGNHTISIYHPDDDKRALNRNR